MELQKINSLLSNTSIILRHQKQIALLKGEQFNIFSILRMESKENDTHSAFLAELLQPNGSHNKGAVFLELFLQTIGHKAFEHSYAQVKTEHHIGKRNIEDKEGGRIDIFISNQGKSISIENKIYAGDQAAQIVRYCNYNKANNTVYYLTLNGDEPSNESKENLESGKDFHLISYKQHIVDWLSLCLKETAEHPLIRETIKQYIIIIKKLTNTMDNKADTEQLYRSILNNYEEAGYIYANYKQAGKIVAEEIRQGVFQALSNDLSNEFIVWEDSDARTEKYAQIWMKLKAYPNSDLYFGIESFSGEGHFNGELFVAVFNSKFESSDTKFERKSNFKQMNRIWINIQILSYFEGLSTALNNSSLISKLQNDRDFRLRFVAFVAQQVKEYIEIHKQSLVEYLDKESK